VLNQTAGNVGRTVRLEQREEHAAGHGSYAEMQQLVARMRTGAVGALLVHGPNPLYNCRSTTPSRRRWTPCPSSRRSRRSSTRPARAAHLLLPDHHFLESWGDYVPRTGLTTLVQPVMTPVFDTKQTGDVLLSVARRASAALPSQASTYYDYLRGRWQRGICPAPAPAPSTTPGAKRSADRLRTGRPHPCPPRRRPP
jgi:anaerobic selenocysteine-containing dehydrogenase